MEGKLTPSGDVLQPPVFQGKPDTVPHSQRPEVLAAKAVTVEAVGDAERLMAGLDKLEAKLAELEGLVRAIADAVGAEVE